MILTIDIGNTNVTLGGYKNDMLSFTARVATYPPRTADQYAVELNQILQLNGVNTGDISGAVIGSVVPSVGTAYKRAVRRLCNVEPVVIGSGIKTGLNIRIDNPAQLGADLVCGAVGAISKYPAPCIIFDLGTATTISVIDKDCAMIGGAIAAGLVTTMNALATKTAQLPFVDIEAPSKPIGSNTVDCIKSGLILGAAAMLDGIASRFEKQLGCEATLVATGGLAEKVVVHCEREIIIDDTLLLDGLLQIYKKNCK